MKMIRIIGKGKEERDVPADQVEDMLCSGWAEAKAEKVAEKAPDKAPAQAEGK